MTLVSVQMNGYDAFIPVQQAKEHSQKGEKQKATTNKMKKEEIVLMEKTKLYRKTTTWNQKNHFLRPSELKV